MIARRHLSLAALAAVAAGCSAQSLNVGVIDGSPPETFTPVHALDILFVIDDSSLTRNLQQNLVRNFPLFMTRLLSTPGLPSLHLAVISTDLGAGSGSVGGCDATGGQKGLFQSRPRGTCTTSGLEPGATFISDIDGARNYSGSIADVFGCIAQLGDSGCGYEHQLAAITRALGADGLPPPPENDGFLRPDATLVIVVVTDEDDCSAPPGSELFGTTTGTSLDSPLGPLGNYRCNEFGHLCNGAKPPRLPPDGDVNQVVTLEGCTSAEEAGMLIPVANIAAQLRALKASPNQVVVAAIAGPSTPYTVQWTNSTSPARPGPRPHIAASCTGADSSSAAPAVRIAQWVRAFGANGIMLPVCADNYGPSLDRVVELMNDPPPVITR